MSFCCLEFFRPVCLGPCASVVGISGDRARSCPSKVPNSTIVAGAPIPAFPRAGINPRAADGRTERATRPPRRPGVTTLCAGLRVGHQMNRFHRPVPNHQPADANAQETMLAGRDRGDNRSNAPVVRNIRTTGPMAFVSSWRPRSMKAADTRIAAFNKNFRWVVERLLEARPDAILK